MAASLAVAVERPRWWLLALAGFLLRGGILVFLLPIVVLPTPAGLANAFAPTLVGFVFGSPSDSFIALVVLLSAGTTAWLLFGGLVAAWIDVVLVAEVASAPALGLRVADRAGLAWRALLVRLASHLPLALIAVWAVARLVDAIYAEIITPGDVTVPIVLRVVLRIPEVIALLAGTWLIGETAGGLAARHLVLRPGSGLLDGLARGWLDLVSRPAVPATLLLTSLAVALVAGPTAAAAGYAWGRVRNALASHADPLVIVVMIGSFVAIWLASLGLVAVVVAWRSAAWTFEVGRRRVSPPALRHAAVGEAV